MEIKFFGSNWIFQQDGARSHSHHLTQRRRRDNFSAFIKKDRWPPNSPDFNSLDYSVRDELVSTISWNKLNATRTLIQQLKSSFKRIPESVVFESCAS